MFWSKKDENKEEIMQLQKDMALVKIELDHIKELFKGLRGFVNRKVYGTDSIEEEVKQTKLDNSKVFNGVCVPMGE